MARTTSSGTRKDKGDLSVRAREVCGGGVGGWRRLVGWLISLGGWVGWVVAEHQHDDHFARLRIDFKKDHIRDEPSSATCHG